MKHLERLKKMVTWAYTNEWIQKDPFTAYKLKFKRHEMEFLDKDELAEIEGRDLTDPMLRRVRDLFVFSCYTGLAYVDLFLLRPGDILSAVDGMKWVNTARKKTQIPVNIPLLKPALAIMEKFQAKEDAAKWDTLFPRISNQEVNRSLKLIGEICEIKKRLTFHLARHTFATTVTLLNGVPIETISKLLGHTKLATTMIYTHVMQSKVGLDMRLLQSKLDSKKVQHINLFVTSTLPENLDRFAFIFLDSINSLGLTPDDLCQLKYKYPAKSFICIFQSTKQGSFRGANVFQHDVDVVIEVPEKGKAIQMGRFNQGGQMNIF